MDFIAAEWFGVTIIRPNNLITNVLVGITGYLLYKLIAQKNEQNLSWITWWSFFFLFVGLGTALGGVAHAFNYEYPRVLHTESDHFAWAVAGLGLYFGERTRSVWGKFTEVIGWVAIVKLLLFFILLLGLIFYKFDGFNSFDLVRWNATFSMFIILFATYFWLHRTRKINSLFYFLTGFGIMLIDIPIYNHKLKLHTWIDHHDLGHFLQMICLFIFYLGVNEEITNAKASKIKHLAE